MMRVVIVALVSISLLTGCDFDLFNSNCRDCCEGNIAYECISSGGLGGGYTEYRSNCGESTCVLFLSGPECVTETHKCKSNIKSICVDDNIFNCYEKDGKFYYGGSVYPNCYENEECIETGDEALCLNSVYECDPEAQSICVDKRVAVCYKINDKYYVLFLDNCKNTDCVYDPETKKAECADRLE
jgi:hypothetical protein